MLGGHHKTPPAQEVAFQRRNFVATDVCVSSLASLAVKSHRNDPESTTFVGRRESPKRSKTNNPSWTLKDPNRAEVVELKARLFEVDGVENGFQTTTARLKRRSINGRIPGLRPMFSGRFDRPTEYQFEPVRSSGLGFTIWYVQAARMVSGATLCLRNAPQRLGVRISRMSTRSRSGTYCDILISNVEERKHVLGEDGAEVWSSSGDDGEFPCACTTNTDTSGAGLTSNFTYGARANFATKGAMKTRFPPRREEGSSKQTLGTVLQPGEAPLGARGA
ncbi:hypothetical protein ZHAS_00017670 [Anopheles sinensis]|uniref:Uncharacterized protein n=1 Tax=Anopheles sinensis TaxID=74873 RepID=A0A084WHF5_ANOSI|nr:hypothetical protein ZHAS_00017670 [Anopheles sinensis]